MSGWVKFYFWLNLWYSTVDILHSIILDKGIDLKQYLENFNTHTDLNEFLERVNSHDCFKEDEVSKQMTITLTKEELDKLSPKNEVNNEFKVVLNYRIINEDDDQYELNN